MKLLEQILGNTGKELTEKPVISFIGAGGKTTCVFALAQELADAGKKVLVTTTTHMENPGYLGKIGCLDGDAEKIKRFSKLGQVTVAGIAGIGMQKMKALPEPVFQEVFPYFDAVVIEADGAKHHPFKVPALHEPVLLPETTHVVLVLGEKALYRPVEEVCFRMEEARKLIPGLREEELLTPALAGRLLELGYIKQILEKFPQTDIKVLCNLCTDEKMRMELQASLPVPVIGRRAFPAQICPNIHVIVLAAGLSRRFGSNKLLYEINGRPMYSYLLERLVQLCEERADIGSLVVVSRYEEILEAAEKAGACIGKNEHSEQGITTSIHLGIQKTRELIDKSKERSPGLTHFYCFFTADQPHLTKETVSRFLDGFIRSGKGTGALSFQGVPGNPVIFHEKYLAELLALTGDRGGKRVFMAHREDAFCCELDSEKELRDYDVLEQKI